MKNTIKKLLSMLLVAVMLLGSAYFPNEIAANATATGYLSVGDIIEFGSYPQTDVSDIVYTEKTVTLNNKTYAVEPIKWRVLRITDGKALLLTEKIVDGQHFNLTSATVNGIPANNYTHSLIRHWLTETFYNMAFSTNEKSALIETQLEESTDSIFLLSKSEAETYASKYFATTATDYSYANGFVTINTSNHWFTRTAGPLSYQVYYVEKGRNNYVVWRNDFDDSIGNTKLGVRPAIYVDIEAYNNLVQSGPIFPAGYDFDNDRYKFENIEETIDIKYYTGMFGEKKGTEIHNYIEDGSTHGHCYGMALTTAATLLYSPAVAYYISWIGFPYTELRNVNPGTLNIDIGMSAKDYIKYGHIYQFSVNSIIEENRNKNKLSALFSAVESYTKGGAPLIIGLLEGDNEAGPSGHAVYAIGIDGDDILVNDSNEPKAIKRIEIDGSTWHYSGGGWTWTNKDSDITYFTDVLTPYMNIKMAVDVVGANVPADESEEICGTGNRFAIGMPTESDGTNLVVDSTDSFRFVQKDSMLTIGQGMTSDEATSNNVGSLYWLIDGHTIEAQNVSSKNAIVKVTGDEMSISANIPTDAQTSITIDSEKDNNISILCNPHELSNITFSTVNAKGEFIDTQISGTASGDTITATQTETGLLVTGISDGTVTLSKNEEVIATKTVTDAISDIEITYDKTGADTSVELEYEQAECEHDDTDGDGKCDACGAPVETPPAPETPDTPADDDNSCSCICHSENSIVQFFYIIFRFLWQLFGMNMDCACGVKHFDFYIFA